MYRPNFCAECGEKIVRLKWRIWTSQSFCDTCSKVFRKKRLVIHLLSVTLPLILGFACGRAGRPASPPLIIERSANSPLNEPPVYGPTSVKESPANQKQINEAPPELVYICGARTRKGKPCSRRVNGMVRCWQHLGLPAMLSKEKLLVRDQ